MVYGKMVRYRERYDVIFFVAKAFVENSIWAKILFHSPKAQAYVKFPLTIFHCFEIWQLFTIESNVFYN